jgi:signal transduction histidine kinase
MAAAPSRRGDRAITSFLISARPPSARQEQLARGIGAVLLAAFLVTVAFRHVQLPRADAYVPIANTVVCLNDFLTASLLFAQFSVTRSRALLALASAFLFKTLILVPHALTFPGAFAPSGLLGAQLQTTAWLYLSQHVGFLLGAIIYTRLGDRRAVLGDQRSAALPIAMSVAAVVAVVVSLTWLVTEHGTPLPPIMADPIHTTLEFRNIGGPLLVLLSLTSIVVFRQRPRSMIDLWLRVALWSWVFETLLQAIVEARFSLVFYVGRTLGALSSSFVLLVLLSESLMLHTRLVLSMAAREQEREGQRTAMDVMIGSMAHELRQPLTSIKANGSAGARMLASAPNETGEIRAILDDIGTSVDRANEIVDSVRTMFAASPRDRASIDANELVRAAVEMMRLEFETHRVAIHLDLASGLPAIHVHRGQLMQVLVNGMTNAVESFAGVSDRAREVHIRTLRDEPGGISIVIEDSGFGLDPDLQARVFEPFYSTKERGRGLGLSICQSIVEAHGGTLSLLSGSKHGAVFRIELPVLSGADPLQQETAPSPVASRVVTDREPVALPRLQASDRGARS